MNTDIEMSNAPKRKYQSPRLVCIGSFEELTQAANSFENLIIFGLTGTQNVDAVS